MESLSNVDEKSEDDDQLEENETVGEDDDKL